MFGQFAKLTFLSGALCKRAKRLAQFMSVSEEFIYLWKWCREVLQRSAVKEFCGKNVVPKYCRSGVPKFCAVKTVVMKCCR